MSDEPVTDRLAEVVTMFESYGTLASQDIRFLLALVSALHAEVDRLQAGQADVERDRWLAALLAYKIPGQP